MRTWDGLAGTWGAVVDSARREEGKGPEMLLRHNGWDLSMRQASNLGNFSPMQNSREATLGRDGVDIGQGQREGI